MIIFGPIPSRRLGKSLGINNVPMPKTCTYACIYCQVGPTRNHTIERAAFYTPPFIFDEVKKHLDKIRREDFPDYLTFVPNGEPTLDMHLGESIRRLKSLGIPVAIITNASLLSDKKVIDELCEADWVSLKNDSADETIWRSINHPHKHLQWEPLQKGLDDFAKVYQGTLVTETMLVEGINDAPEVLRHNAARIASLNPYKAYLTIPIRPPASSKVHPPTEQVITEAYQIYDEQGLKTELLLGFEGTDTGFTGNAEEDILNISAVHPIREDTMAELLRKNKANPELVDRLVEEKKIKVVSFNGKNFFLRNIHSKA